MIEALKNEVFQSNQMHLIIDSVFRHFKKNIAVIDENRSLTYGELLEKVQSLAARLQSLPNWHSGIVISFDLDKNIESLTLLLSILYAGGTYTSYMPENPNERIKSLMESSNSQVLITNQISKRNSLKSDTLEIYDFSSLLNFEQASFPRDVNNEIAYIITTSGTTGKPKAIFVSVRSMLHAILVNYRRNYGYDHLSWEEIYQIDSVKKIGMTSFYSFDPSVMQIFTALLFGNELYLVSEYTKRDLFSFEKFLKQNNVEVLDITPTHLGHYFHLFENQDEFYLPSTIISIGEPLKQIVVKKFFSHPNSSKIINCYGPTECTVYSNSNLITSYVENQWGIEPVGDFLDGYSGKVFNANHEETAINEIGELYIISDYLSEGYLNQEELTNQSFLFEEGKDRRTIFKSGDLAFYNNKGELIVIGRNDSQVKIHGQRIELGELESHLEKHPDIFEARIILDKEETSETIHVVYKGRDLSPEEVKIFLQNYLPINFIPATYYRVEEFPMTVNGKLDKKLILSEIKSKGIFHTSFQPTTEDEMILSKILGEVIPDFSIDETGYINLKEVSSLQLFLLASQIYHHWQVQIHLEELLSINNIRDLVKEICSKEVICESDYQSNKEICFPINKTIEQTILWDIKENSKSFQLIGVVNKVKISNYININQLSKALQTVTNRHRLLKSKFVYKDEELAVVIDETITVSPKYIKIKDCNNIHFKEYLEPFDIFTGPLFQVVLFEDSNKNQFLILNFHHFLGDGMSSINFVNELVKCMEAVPLPPIRLDFFSYHDRLNITDDDQYFWKNYLLNRPKVKKRSKTPNDFSIIKGEIDLSSEESEIIREICSREKVTPYVYFISAVFEYLYQEYQQEDIVIGTIMHGRDLSIPTAADMLGYFATMIPVRAKRSKDISFCDFVQQQNRNIQSLLNHQGMDIKQIYSAQSTEDLYKGEMTKILINYHEDHEYIVPETSVKVLIEEAGDVLEERFEYVKITDRRNHFIFSYSIPAPIGSEEKINEMFTKFKKILTSTL